MIIFSKDALAKARLRAESSELSAALEGAKGSRQNTARALGMTLSALRAALARHPNLIARWPAPKGRRPGAKDLEKRKPRSDRGESARIEAVNRTERVQRMRAKTGRGTMSAPKRTD